MLTMERITGINGIVFKARDPDALKAWYRDHLGVPVGADGYVDFGTKDDRELNTIWCSFSNGALKCSCPLRAEAVPIRAAVQVEANFGVVNGDPDKRTCVESAKLPIEAGVFGIARNRAHAFGERSGKEHGMATSAIERRQCG
jgi:catechol 2,3-dioxygenase-like lactoylglutathione lyase family enzyme